MFFETFSSKNLQYAKHYFANIFPVLTLETLLTANPLAL